MMAKCALRCDEAHAIAGRLSAMFTLGQHTFSSQPANTFLRVRTRSGRRPAASPGAPAGFDYARLAMTGGIWQWTIPMRVYFHCGWAILVTPDYEYERLEGGETIRIYEPKERREIFLSSMVVTPHDGKPFRAREALEMFPTDMGGERYDHDEAGLVGSALWFFGDDDIDGPAWVLIGLMISEETQKVARCTIVCTDASDRDWALDTWRGIRRETPEVAALKGKTVIVIEG
jgi:hypothetical protein